MAPTKGFASDNYAGVHPAVLAAMETANAGHVPAYGNDPISAHADEVLRAHFGPEAEIFFVFLGTAANVLALTALARPYEAVACARTAHINCDECGAPERHAGLKLKQLDHTHGKIRPESLESWLESRGFPHHSQPRVVSITQSTELGACYTPEEIRALAAYCHERELYLHMDGARLANAAAYLETDLKALTTDCGVDALSLGGTKNGMMYGEAVVFLNPALAENFVYIRKQGMQLASKMRYIGAQFTALYSGDLWLTNARQANAMAQRLAEGAAKLPGVRLTRPVQANAVFATLPREARKRLQAVAPFYVWDPEIGEVRWMCAFDHSEADVDDFLRELEKALAEG